MRSPRTLARWGAALLAVGALLLGGVAPTHAAAPQGIYDTTHDTGWNGT